MGDKNQQNQFGGGFVQPGQQQNPQQQQYGFPQQQHYPQQQRGFVAKSDQEANRPDNFASSFDDKSVRRGFMRRVYSILMFQLGVTAAIIAIFMFVAPVKGFVRSNIWFMYTSWGLCIALIIALVCCGSLRRKSPHNMILLGIFTILWSCVLGTVSTFYEVDAVLIAVSITAAIVLGLTLFALQTKIDFTMCGGLFCALLIVLIIGGFLLWLLPSARFVSENRKYMMIGFGCAGAFVFSLYLIYDTQLMMIGKHKYSLSPEEYVFAALNLYLDVTQLFMYILMAVGGGRSD